jgi:hypothetical protein
LTKLNCTYLCANAKSLFSCFSFLFALYDFALASPAAINSSTLSVFEDAIEYLFIAR